MKDFRVKVRAYNNRLLERREKLGLSQKALAAQAGIPAGEYNKYENMRKTAWNPKKNNWRPDAVKLAAFHDVSEFDLFPESLKMIEARPVEMEVDACEVEALMGASIPTPHKALESSDLNTKVREVISTLTPREEKVIRAHFGIGEDERTFEEIGEEFGVGRNRIRQIECKALRKLRHPHRAKRLIDYCEEGPAPKPKEPKPRPPTPKELALEKFHAYGHKERSMGWAYHFRFRNFYFLKCRTCGRRAYAKRRNGRMMIFGEALNVKCGKYLP